jgi:hypothetical protein
VVSNNPMNIHTRPQYVNHMDLLRHGIPKIGSPFSFSWSVGYEMWGAASHFIPHTLLGWVGDDFIL